MTYPAKDLVLGILQKNRMPLTHLLLIAAVFEMCAPDPNQPLDTKVLAQRMLDIAERFGVDADLQIQAFLTVLQRPTGGTPHAC